MIAGNEKAAFYLLKQAFKNAEPHLVVAYYSRSYVVFTS